MMHHGNRTVNVKRVELLAALKSNLAEHRAQYAEAVIDYRAKVLSDLKAKIKQVNAASDADLVKLASVHLQPPQNHETDYTEMIDLFSVSIDENINLDHQSFKSFFKNEWSWTSQFVALSASYKA